MPHSVPVDLSRRQFIAAAAAAAGLAVAGGCALPAGIGHPDALLGLLEAAERDARELAAADASHGELAGALRRIADARRIHAQHLADLVERPEGDQGLTPSSASPLVCPPVEEVRARLRADAAGAAEAAAESKGARAEIAGAVSAACTVAVEVELA